MAILLFQRVVGRAEMTDCEFSPLLSDREKFVFGADENRFIGTHWGTVDTAAHVDFIDRFDVIFSEFENGNVPIFIYFSSCYKELNINILMQPYWSFFGPPGYLASFFENLILVG